MTANGSRARVVAWGVIGSLQALALLVNTLALVYTLRRLMSIVEQTQHDLTR